MAIDELNANDGILGRDVELHMADSQNDPGVAKKKYTELTLQEEVDVTTGGWLGPVINVIMEGMKDSKTLHIGDAGASIAPNDLIKEDYETYKYWFRIAENAVTSAYNRFAFIKDNWKQHGWDKIAVIYEDLGYNQFQQQYFEQSFSDIGAENVLSLRYPTDTKDFSTIFDKVESAGADMLYGVIAVTGTPAVTQWYKQQRPFQLVGTVSAAQQSSFFNNVNGNCQYFISTIADVPGGAITDQTVPFQEKFKKQHDQYPSLTGYYGYMTVNAFAAAAETAGNVNSDDLVDALENMKKKSLLGTLEFYGRDNRNVHDAIMDKDHIYWQFFQWQEENGAGVQKSVWPEDRANGTYQTPPWLQ